VSFILKNWKLTHWNDHPWIRFAIELIRGTTIDNDDRRGPAGELLEEGDIRGKERGRFQNGFLADALEYKRAQVILRWTTSVT